MKSGCQMYALSNFDLRKTATGVIQKRNTLFLGHTVGEEGHSCHLVPSTRLVLWYAVPPMLLLCIENEIAFTLVFSVVTMHP